MRKQIHLMQNAERTTNTELNSKAVMGTPNIACRKGHTEAVNSFSEREIASLRPPLVPVEFRKQLSPQKRQLKIELRSQSEISHFNSEENKRTSLNALPISPCRKSENEEKSHRKKIENLFYKRNSTIHKTVARIHSLGVGECSLPLRKCI